MHALNDCLTGEQGRLVRRELSGREAMEATGFGRRLLRTLEDAAEASPCFELAEPKKEIN